MELLNLVFGTCGNNVGIELELKEFLIYSAGYMNFVKWLHVKILKEEFKV